MANRHDPFIKQGTLDLLEETKENGATWREVADYLNTHHGVASGRLSMLHQAGQIERLSAKRGGSRVYVLPEYVEGRKTETYGRGAVSV